MKTLSAESFERAGQFLKEQARPLERALFEFHFENGSAEAVCSALEDFRNPDGGFGHALEPDMRTPSSSALATGIALRHLHEIGAHPDHPLVRGTVLYLFDTLDAHTFTWRVVPPDANQHPHAPWWHDKAGSLARTFDQFQIIPRAELAAAIYALASPTPLWLNDLANRTVTAIETHPVEKFSGDDFVYAESLAQAPGLPAELRQRVETRLQAVAPAIVTRDPGEWSGYGAPPLKLAPSPKALAAGLLAEDLQRHLDYQIEHQNEAGGWDPTWTWGDTYPEDWQIARREWQGVLTLETLLSLREFERL